MVFARLAAARPVNRAGAARSVKLYLPPLLLEVRVWFVFLSTWRVLVAFQSYSHGATVGYRYGNELM